ncbi:MAG TPA: amidohydrolase family protein [Bryobacteraceae bacterium]|nr:amidohydrolase family protein [Bryobacteraceae bacterium]
MSNNFRTFPSQFNTLRIDSMNNFNVNMTKGFTILENIRLQFRAESFNLTNRPRVRYAEPDGDELDVRVHHHPDQRAACHPVGPAADFLIAHGVTEQSGSVLQLNGMSALDRRAFLASAAGSALTGPLKAQSKPIPIIDCHIHLFDQTRPQGAPYSGGGANKEPALPARYRKLASPLGIVGAIEVEASPWVEDNLWVLEVEQSDPLMVGTIGNLQPDKPEFKEYLDRYHKNKLFLGIRYGNLWGYNLVNQVGNPAFIEGIRLMQQADLALDTANPRPDLIEAVLRLTEKVPDLRVIIDHLPSLMARLEANAKAAVEANLMELAHRPRVYIKVSEVMRIAGGEPSTDPRIYKPLLDGLFDIFGEDRLIFGSDWPNGPAVDHLPAIVRIVQDYFAAKGRGAAEKYFWKNSVAAYKWARRDAAQPQVA